MKRLIHKAEENYEEYISALRTDINKANALSNLLKQKAEQWIDPEEWMYEYSSDYEVDDDGSKQGYIKGPSIEDKFREFIEVIVKDLVLDNFFQANLSSEDREEISQYIYDGVITNPAHDVIEKAIDEAKKLFKRYDLGKSKRNNY